MTVLFLLVWTQPGCLHFSGVVQALS